MLKDRFVTSLVLLTILVLNFYLDYLPLLFLTGVTFYTAAIQENARMFLPAGKSTLTYILIPLSLFFLGIHQKAYLNSSAMFLFCIAIWLFLFIPTLTFKLGSLAMGGFFNSLIFASYNIAIFGFFLAFLVLFQYSKAYLLSVMAIVWTTDIGAYFFGRSFGYHRMAPNISPKKSWEGAVGAWILVIFLTSMLFYFNFLPELKETLPVRLLNTWGWPLSLLIITLLVAAGIVGDLFESLLKRKACIKESGRLLPGHGGVLDRLDSLILVLPLATLLRFLC